MSYYLLVSAATSNITSGMPYIAHNPQRARQHNCSCTDPPSGEPQSQPLPLGSGAFAPRPSGQSEDNSRIIEHKMPSRMRLEVRSQYNLKFDPGASTLGAPPPPWEAQRPPGVEMSPGMPATLVDLSWRALDCRHVCIVLTSP